MPALLEDIGGQAQSLLGLEGVAVAAAIAYLPLAIRQRLSCWYFAALSSALYVYILFDARLYMESALNVFYFLMAVYGWMSWYRRGDSVPLPVSSWPPSRHASAVIVVIAMSAASGYLLATTTDAAFPYVDSATTWGALWATFLVARKVLENWWYWLIIDAALVVVFALRDLELTAILYTVYLFMIPFGLVAWRRAYADSGRRTT